MINLEKARQLVKQDIESFNSTNDLMIYDESTIEFNYGWVFFFDKVNATSEGYLLGNAPYLVDKFSGKFIRIATSESVEQFYLFITNPKLKRNPSLIYSFTKKSCLVVCC